MVLPVSKAALSRIQRRHHLNRLSSLEPPKPPVVRYERDAPSDLLHLDIKKLGRFARPGVRAIVGRTQRNPGAGVESLHVAVDDHSRLAFASLHPDEKTPSVITALHQAVDFYKAYGIQIQRVLTDRGSTYRSKLFAAACKELGLRHLFTKPYRPQTKDKAERFIQTITCECAYARRYDSSNHRATFLLIYLHDYNFHRPHSALHSLPPSSRLPITADNVPEVQQLGTVLFGLLLIEFPSPLKRSAWGAPNRSDAREKLPLFVPEFLLVDRKSKVFFAGCALKNGRNIPIPRAGRWSLPGSVSPDCGSIIDADGSVKHGLRNLLGVSVPKDIDLYLETFRANLHTLC